MPYPILGLHHVTATVDDAQADLDLYIRALGLRLVKKTVNFDNHGVYHFYYGDEVGTPGTIWTTFPYKGRNVRVGSRGAGQIAITSFSVPSKSLDEWKRRVEEHGFGVTDARDRFDQSSILVSDPSGLQIELVGDDRDARAPWTGADVNEDMAIRGLHSVTMFVHDPEPTIDFMRNTLRFEVSRNEGACHRLTVNGDLPGRTIDVVESTGPAGVNGLGTVHHVAMAIDNPDEQVRLREELLTRGLQVTPLMDRQYFRSIYFREPGGVLFEVATTAPGFAVDEPVAELGRALKLPPWEEPNRATIEAVLPAVSY